MSTETETSRTEIFDSLPYYDDDLQKFPYLKEKVDQELARELKAPQTLHPRVPPSVELFAVREHAYLSEIAFDFDHMTVSRIIPF
jgi:pre-mRNA-splicing factor SPF27